MNKIIFIFAFIMFSASFVCKIEATEQRIANTVAKDSVKQDAQNPEDDPEYKMRQEAKKN